MTHIDVKKIARLARLGLSDAEALILQADMARLAPIIDTIQQIKTDVEPLSNPLSCYQRLREDSITPPSERALLLQNAPATVDGLFLVTQVLDNH